jgi:ankyrin repeat protein
MSAAATTPATTRGREEEEDEVRDHLVCAVCLDAPPAHVYQCRYGHLLCSGCLTEVRSRAGLHPLTCPTCRVGLLNELIRCLAAEQTIALLPATCRHCIEKTTRGALVSHEWSCPSAPDVTCSAHAEGCVWVGKESRRSAHETGCAIVRLCARFDVERQATASVVDALLHTTTSAQAGKNKALRLAAAHDNLALLAGRLIAGGADVDAAPDGGYTPLYIACDHGNVVMKERLIAAGSRLNTASNSGSTPLFIAAHNNRPHILKLLIAAGADVNKAQVNGCTPLHAAAHGGHADVVSVLLEAVVVDPNAAPVDGTSAGITPLYVAARNNRLDILKLLIAAGADVNKVQVIGATPLHMAARHGHAGVVDLLITAGANVHATLTSGTTTVTTALSTALARGHAEVVQKLRAAGAN